MFKYTAVAVRPLRVRFEYRKSQSGRGKPKASPNETDAEVPPGVVVAVFYIGKTYNLPVTTGIVTTRAVWDSRRSLRPSVAAKELVREMIAYEAVTDQVYLELLKTHDIVNGQMIANGIAAFINGENTIPTLPKVFDEFLKSKQARIESDLSDRDLDSISQATYNTYPKRWNLIYGYLQATKQTQHIVANVDYPFAFRLKEWLQSQKQPNGDRYQSATINKVISLLKQVMVYAQSRGHIKHNPLVGFSCRGGSPANPKPLTIAHLDHLETCELPYTFRRFCDAWLVAAELCLHHADFLDLPNCVFIEHGDRRYLQRKRRKQQGHSLTQTVDVTPRAERILAKYGGVKGLAYTSSAYYSKVLKQIAQKADLRDEAGRLIDLQFGMGRDTGLTLRAIDGANSIQLSKMAGWSKPVYAERYIGGAVDIVAAFADAKDRKATTKQPSSTPPDEPTTVVPSKMTPIAGTPFSRVA